MPLGFDPNSVRFDPYLIRPDPNSVRFDPYLVRLDPKPLTLMAAAAEYCESL